MPKSARTLAREAKLSHEQLIAFLHYDPLTGIFTRKVATSSWGRFKPGTVIGTPQGDGGHIVIRIGDIGLFLAHRLAWFYVHGEWPADQLDHRDLDKQNNRLVNLREATDTQNRQNMPRQRNNKSGHIGVCWDKVYGKWRANIGKGRKQIHLGRFADKNDAIAAYAEAKARLHTFNPTVRPANELRS